MNANPRFESFAREVHVRSASHGMYEVIGRWWRLYVVLRCMASERTAVPDIYRVQLNELSTHDDV